MVSIYDWYKNTPGAIMPSNPSTDPGMEYWNKQVDSMGMDKAYLEFLKSIATINATNSGYSGSVTDLGNAWKSFENPVKGQEIQLRTDPNNPNTLETLYSGQGYNINPEWGRLAALGQSTSGVQMYLSNNNFGTDIGSTSGYQAPTATKPVSPTQPVTNPPVASAPTPQSQPVTNPPVASAPTPQSQPGLGNLFPRQNWGNFQGTNRGARYFDQGTGNYSLSNLRF